MSKENVISGKAIKNAEEMLINEKLLKAWNKIITKPDERLDDLLLAGVTEELCGHKPNTEMVENFLTKIYQRKSDQIVPPTPPTSKTGNSYTRIVNLMLSEHREQFDRVLSLVGRKRPYFTRNPDELRDPVKINKTDIFVETNLCADSIVTLSKKLTFRIQRR
ncbi:MAG: hypothetical protein ACP5PP_00860 [Fervidobacterium sp.]